MKRSAELRSVSAVVVLAVFGGCDRTLVREYGEFEGEVAALNASLSAYGRDHEVSAVQFEHRARCLVQLVAPWPETNAQSKGLAWAESRISIDLTEDVERTEFVPAYEVPHETWTEHWNAHFRIHFRRPLVSTSRKLLLGGTSPEILTRTVSFASITASDYAPAGRNSEIVERIGRLVDICAD
jgi:hypothetical protein